MQADHPSGNSIICYNFDMTNALEQAIAQSQKLSVTDRAELASYLLNSLDATVDATADAAWEKELNQRQEDIRNGTAIGQPTENVFSELREKYA
jgi:putative addiction module component (TIGR02574 family)